MITLLSDNIISSLGFTAEENFQKMKMGITGLAYYEGYFGLPEPFMASMIDEQKLNNAFSPLSKVSKSKTNYTKLEKAAILSASEAINKAEINPADPDVLFILSTTKGNVFLLDSNETEYYDSERVFLWRSAELIAEYFGNTNPPITISNACISGAYAMLAAQRALLTTKYKYVIVIGVDMLSRFIISGFQSFKALSQSICKPFDEHRNGLNIGEAAATIILSDVSEADRKPNDVVLSGGAIRNDANHISGPSRTGEGAFLALKNICTDINTNELAFINAHGTATLYNDEMEAYAITRASLQHIPVTCQKGYIGHTLGAAGVVESIISVRSLKEHIVLKTYGFNTSGVSHQLQIVKQTQAISGNRCINMLSGFGGCNAALSYSLISS